MKKIHIFKTGKHTSAGGTTLEFNEDILSNAATGYDPSLHEAPIVIGHPKSNGPAYGWIKSLEFSDGDIHAEPHQVNADFEEMVTNGAFKKVSASWYLPDSPTNPKPGTLYLRHVGFLGAQPPAIKGLQAIEFNEATEGVVEFEESWDSAWNLQGITGVFKRMREFLIDKFSREEADTVIPDYVIEDLSRSAERKLTQDQPTQNYEENDMTLEELQAKVDQLEADKATISAERDQLQERVTNFEEQEKNAKRERLEASVDALIKQGKVLPAHRAQVIAFAEMLDESGKTVEFGEGDNKEEVTGSAALMKFIEAQGQKVDFNEHTADDEEPAQPMDSRTLAAKAVEYQEEQRQKGRTIDIATAVNEVQKQAE